MKKLWNFGWDFYKKHREGVSYLFWGGVAFVLSTSLFWLFAEYMGMNEVLANTIDWIICVIFTFFTNKWFVFKSKTGSLKAFGKEFVEFTVARFFTLILENVIIWIGCTKMGFDHGIGQMLVKFVGQFIVVVTNYVLSKVWIFRGKKSDE